MKETFKDDLDMYLDRNIDIRYQLLNIILYIIPIILISIFIFINNKKNIKLNYIIIINIILFGYLILIYILSKYLYNNITLYNNLIYSILNVLTFGIIFLLYFKLIE